MNKEDEDRTAHEMLESFGRELGHKILDLMQEEYNKANPLVRVHQQYISAVVVATLFDVFYTGVSGTHTERGETKKFMYERAKEFIERYEKEEVEK